MEYVQLKDICSPRQWKTVSSSNLCDNGYPVYGANGVIGYYSDYNHKDETVLITCRGATCGSVNICKPYSYVNGNAMALDNLSKNVDLMYLYYFLKWRGFNDVVSGSAQPQIIRSTIGKIKVPICSMVSQQNIVKRIKQTEQVINRQKKQLNLLDELVRARFSELFGDLRTNSKKWKITHFTECAKIDTNMIHEFDAYKNYPHIGIDSIEKNTGRLIGYRTIEEDHVVSGKYLFSSKHIIYSKIRPNLNKVALPDFDGLFSADAYPILVKEGICNREYLGYTLRSDFFLDYILTFSSRTNLPKVNKKQVEGFDLPLPPLSLQNQFADFVKEVDKSRLHVLYIS